MKTLNFITGNKNKLSEVRAILGETVVVDNKSVDVPEIQGTIEEIAKEKCRRAADAVNCNVSMIHGGSVILKQGDQSRTLYSHTDIQIAYYHYQVGGPVLTEDTALEFHAYKGLPGPYIKSFLEALGHEGLNKMLDSFDDRSAEAVCTFAFSNGPGEEPLIFQGRTLGKIVSARGPPNFGWDPIFEYEGKTYAEMEKEEKNKISHRYKALMKLKAWLVENEAGSSS
ncbi:nucleoside triphosphate pyrophosphohydrolase ham1 [Talaromyces marneffei ATCC 18224]